MLGLFTASIKQVCLRPTLGAYLHRSAVCALHTVIQRDDSFNQIAGSDIEHFRGILDEKDIITDPEILEPYNRCFECAADHRQAI
jgi:hypothetical protein